MTDRLVASAAGLPSATLHEAAGRTGALPSRIKPLSPEMRLCGPAYPVRSAAGDNLRIHHGLYAARPGDVLVVDCGDATEFGYWGEVMTWAAQQAGLAGLVISGGVRDCRQIVTLGFPVFAANVCIRGTAKSPDASGSVGEPVTLGDVPVSAGDLVVGDADGVVVVEAGRAEAVIHDALQRERSESAILAQLRAGATTLDIYRLPCPAGE